MKWLLKDAVAGDMIRVKLGDIYHYGIYVNDSDVIQFGPPPERRITKKDSEIEVLSTDIDAFLIGGFLEVAEFDKKEKKRNRAPEDVIAYARSRIGTRGYNILYNNCEHFANECISGVASCSQADRVREMFRTMPIVDIYLAEIPEGVKIKGVYPKERDEEIRSVSNERVKREKYFVWKLLEYALERSLGIKIKKAALTKNEAGKWTTDSCYISLSHSGSAVAVAISRAAVGVDIELLSSSHTEKLAQKILTKSENDNFLLQNDSEKNVFLIKKWSMKEAIFKKENNKIFEPSKIESSTENAFSKIVRIGGEDFICSVATDTPEKCRFFEGINLSKV